MTATMRPVTRYQATCKPCSWNGRVRIDKRDAEDDSDAHNEQHHWH